MAQGSSIRDLTDQLVAGRLSRRAFVARAVALGFSASAIAGILAACGTGTPTATTAPAASAAPASTAPAASAAASAAPAASAGASAPAASARPSAAASAGASSAGTPAAGGAQSGGIGAVTTRPLAKGGGIGPGPTRRGGSGTLKLLWWQAPTILNAHQAAGTKDYDASRLVYEPLADFGPDDKLVPWLAAEIPTRESGAIAADGRSVTWKLKSGVKWSDGTPFTSKDVAFTFRYCTDPATAAVSLAYYQNIASVDTPDDTTVKINFKEPTPGWYVPFVGSNGYVLPEHIFKDGVGAAAKNHPANLKPIGTGPYKVDSFSPGDIVNYSINENWRDATGPAFDKVEMKGGGDAPSAARAVLQTGDYNVAWNLQVEPQILNQLASGGRGRIEQLPNWGIERIHVNMTDPVKEVNGQRSEKNTPHPFQADKKVRQAYNLLCDRKTISDTLYGPAGQPTANWLTQPAI